MHNLELWKKTTERSQKIFEEWENRFEQSSKKKRFKLFIDSEISQSYERKMNSFIKQMKQEKPRLATRQSSQKTLELINKII